MNNPQNTPNEKIIIGRFGAPFGVKGEIKVISFTDPMENIVEYDPLWIQQNSAWQQLKIENYRFHGKFVLVKLANCDSPEAARFYTNKDIAIDKNQLPNLAANEFYWSDLEGLKVINQQQQELGIVDHVMNTGANDILVVKKNRKEQLIPFIKNVIIKVDLVQQQLIVDWEQDF